MLSPAAQTSVSDTSEQTNGLAISYAGLNLIWPPPRSTFAMPGESDKAIRWPAALSVKSPAITIDGLSESMVPRGDMMASLPVTLPYLAFKMKVGTGGRVTVVKAVRVSVVTVVVRRMVASVIVAVSVAMLLRRVVTIVVVVTVLIVVVDSAAAVVVCAVKPMQEHALE